MVVVITTSPHLGEVLEDKEDGGGGDIIAGPHLGEVLEDTEDEGGILLTVVKLISVCKPISTWGTCLKAGILKESFTS